MVNVCPVVVTNLDFNSTTKKPRHLAEDHPRNIPAKFAFKLFVSFREENFKKIFSIGFNVDFVLGW